MGEIVPYMTYFYFYFFVRISLYAQEAFLLTRKLFEFRITELYCRRGIPKFTRLLFQSRGSLLPRFCVASRNLLAWLSYELRFRDKVRSTALQRTNTDVRFRRISVIITTVIVAGLPPDARPAYVPKDRSSRSRCCRSTRRPCVAASPDFYSFRFLYFSSSPCFHLINSLKIPE